MDFCTDGGFSISKHYGDLHWLIWSKSMESLCIQCIIHREYISIPEHSSLVLQCANKVVNNIRNMASERKLF